MSSISPLRSMLPAIHQRRLSDFAQDLQEAVRRYVPTDFGRYQSASILAFSWSNDTMGVNVLRDELLQLLHRAYGFKTESYVFDAKDTLVNIQSDFRDKLIEFTKTPRNDAKHLKVFYYSGHSDSGPNEDQLRLAWVNHLIFSYFDWSLC